MFKKMLTVPGIVAVLAAVFLLGSLSLGTVFAQTQHTSPPAQAAVQSVEDDDAAEAALKGPDTDAVEEQVGDQNELDEQQPQYTGSITVDDSQYEGMSEAEEAAALQDEVNISATEAEAAALADNPGATVIETELDNENGVLVYSVELSNGNDVKVDAGNGQILHTEAGDLDNEGESGEQETAED
jgi:uncharacterized membrane protein YkoI